VKIKPLKHQEIVSNFLLKDNNKGLLLFHNVGSGKTITSLFSAKLLLDKYPNKKILIITPTSLVENYNKEIKKLNIDFKDSLTIYSYGIFVNLLKEGKMKMCSKNILIIDEAHNFVNNGIRSKYIMKCARKAFKILLLTASPLKNTPLDIINLLAMINKEKDIKDLKRRLKVIMKNNLDKEFDKLFKCKVSFFKANDLSNYPSSTEHNINLIMTQEYYKEYYKIENNIREDLPEIFLNTKNLISFLNGARRAVNKVNLTSPKIIWTINKIKEDLKNDKKVLIYSAWKSAGINILKKYLKEHKIIFSEVSGGLSKETRNKLVNNYNDNKTKIMLITASGTEGLDLKETRSIIILDQHWNETRIHQIIGRGIRYKSHANLPLSKRHVDIYYLYLNKPEKKYIDDNTPGADTILKTIAENKSIEIINFYKKLEKISIEKNSKCL